MDDDIKPGHKTSEFWISVAVSTIGMLVTLGVIQASDADEIGSNVTMVIRGVAGLWVALVPLGYGLWRTWLKAQNMFSKRTQE